MKANCFSKLVGRVRRVNRNIDCGFRNMTPAERKYRIKYLWSRARIVYNMIRFLIMIDTNRKENEEKLDLDHAHFILREEDGLIVQERVKKICFCLSFQYTLVIWLTFMSFVHWFNLLVTPIVMLWPELWPSPSYSLWLCELMFLLDVLRKCFVRKPKSLAIDSYDIFVEYLRSSLIIDLIPLVSSFFSGMNLKFTALKISRLY